ncbi:hypothetical protein [uncultured Methanoregula sp.]|uniref:hypothetical protein n=1 Tax=uncultured Methanoregula sp. TaxID=1005933 RepID=UPI002AAB3757|nr:hypothetical protein [uncultured Methanoregula sp.]
MNVDKRYFAFFAVVLAFVVLTAGCTSTAPSASPASAPATTAGTASPLTPQVTAAASTPNLVGVWTGTTTGNTKIDGFRETNTARYNITAQKGSAFSGSKDYTRANGITYHENFSGVISRDGKISIVGHIAGTMTGGLIGPNEAEFTFLQPGDDAKAFIIHLTRQQS